jgi:hypothetical protein
MVTYEANAVEKSTSGTGRLRRRRLSAIGLLSEVEPTMTSCGGHERPRGTYSRTGTGTGTVTATIHGHLVGDRVYLDFTTGTATDGAFTVTTVADANTFNITHGTSESTSGSVTLLRRSTPASGGIQSIAYQASAGSYLVNFSSAFADVNYLVLGSVGTTDADSTLSLDTDNLTTLHCELLTRDISAGAAEDGRRVSVLFLATA